MRSKGLAVVCVIIGASLWGIIGIFTRSLYSSGVSPMQMTFARCLITAVAMLAAITILNRSYLRIEPKDIWMFIGTGLLSVVFFNIMYFTTQQMISLSTASVLLYTAPCFVMMMSVILFKEMLNGYKIIALVTAFVGCAFTTGLGTGDLNIGILYGILAGFGYSLYSIFAKYALKKYHLLTILFYTFLIATVCLIPVCDVPGFASLCGDSDVVIMALGLGIVCTVLPYYFYTTGLEGMDAGEASIIAFVEPMVATILSIAVGDEFGWMNIAGIILILSSIILLNKETMTRIRHTG